MPWWGVDIGAERISALAQRTARADFFASASLEIGNGEVVTGAIRSIDRPSFPATNPIVLRDKKEIYGTETVQITKPVHLNESRVVRFRIL